MALGPGTGQGHRSLTVFLQPHKGPEVDGVEGGADHGDEAAEYERRAQVPGRDHGERGGSRGRGGPARSEIPEIRLLASRSRPGSEEAEQPPLPELERGAESLGSGVGPKRKETAREAERGSLGAEPLRRARNMGRGLKPSPIFLALPLPACRKGDWCRPTFGHARFPSLLFDPLLAPGLVSSSSAPASTLLFYSSVANHTCLH